jgi:hypothetical protein
LVALSWRVALMNSILPTVAKNSFSIS